MEIKLNNIERKKLKLKIKNFIENNTNNVVQKSNIITPNHIECYCENKLSSGHIIDVLIGNKSIHLIYDNCLFLTKII